MYEKFLINLGTWAPTLLVIITGFYVWITKNLVNESKRLREEQYRPRVVIGHEILKRGDRQNEKKELVHLLVQNIGTVPAFNIKFKIESEILTDKGNNLISEIPFIKQTYPYLMPNQKLKDYLFNTETPPEEIAQSTCRGKVSYSDTLNDAGKVFEENFVIDFAYIKDTTLLE